MFNDMQQDIQKAQEVMQSQNESRKAKLEQSAQLYETLKAKGFSIDDMDQDIEGADLTEMRNAEEKLNANIARLINNLDQTTMTMNNELSTMREHTFGEKLFGIFSKQKAREMRAERISSASLEENLQDLVTQSTSIINVLQNQLSELEVEIEVGQENLSKTINDRKGILTELNGVRDEIEALAPKITELELERANAEDAQRRSELDSEIDVLVQQDNALKDKEAVLVNQSMTLERYVKQNQSNVDSLQNQITTQKVMIEKLKTDTEQRRIIWHSLETSLKTAEQQETAHTLNRLATDTDKAVQAVHAQVGSAAQNAMASMMEQHKGDMQDAQKVLDEKRKADEMFARRFGKVLQEHDNESYN